MTMEPSLLSNQPASGQAIREPTHTQGVDTIGTKLINLHFGRVYTPSLRQIGGARMQTKESYIFYVSFPNGTVCSSETRGLEAQEWSLGPYVCILINDFRISRDESLYS